VEWVLACYAHPDWISHKRQEEKILAQCVATTMTLRKDIQEEALRNVQRIGQEIEQEPVAWMDSSGHPKHLRHIQSSEERRLYGELQPLYLHPATTCSGCGESSTKDGFLATYCLKCCEMASGKQTTHHWYDTGYETGYMDGQKVVSGSVQLQLSSGGVRLTEVHYFDVINPEDLDCNGIYLQWLGALGNRSYWLFNAKYGESLQVDGGDTYQTAFDTINNLTERANWYEKKPFKKLTIGAEGLTRNQIDGLKSLLTSTKVDVLTADGTGWKRTGVLVEPGTFTIGRGDDNQFRIEMSIVFPEQFNQTA